MIDPRLADHAVGLELQLCDLVDRRDRAAHDGWPDEVAAIEQEMEAVQTELALTAEHINRAG